MTGVCEESCQLVGHECTGSSQYQADAQCCSGLCDVRSVDARGTHFGSCKASCQPLRATCQGTSFDQADSQCCTGNCDFLTLKDGVYHGHCYAASAAAKTVQGGEKALEETSSTASCKRNTKSCSGWSQDLANSQCCSAYCHVMAVDTKTGFMTGVCEESCKLVTQECTGSSQYQADAQCCSGLCDVLSVDARGTHFGTCALPISNEDASFPCRPVTAPCSGKYINDADDQKADERSTREAILTNSKQA